MNTNQNSLLKKKHQFRMGKEWTIKQPKCETKTTSKNGSIGTKATKDNKDLSKGGGGGETYVLKLSLVMWSK